MSEAFRGEVYQKVDAKGRVSIPAVFRHILEADDPNSGTPARPRLYMVYGGAERDYVECYSKAGSDTLANDISNMDEDSDDRDQAEYDFLSCSVMVEVEPDGRIVLPARVREKIGINGGAGEETVFQGRGTKFRLYHADTYPRAKAERPTTGVDPRVLLGRSKKARSA